jgi:hypothetical protein
MNDLTSATGCYVDVPMKRWAAAEILQQALRESNENRRTADQNRGKEGNERVNLWGAFGELQLLRAVYDLPCSSKARREMGLRMFDPHGGGSIGSKEADLSFDDAGTTIGVDAKTFNCMANYRYFAINAKKHADLKGRCAAYFAVLVPKYAKRAYIARLVPYLDVDKWRTWKLGSEDSPSRNLPISGFIQKYCDKEFDCSKLGNDTYSSAEIEALMKSDAVRKRLNLFIPRLA